MSGQLNTQAFLRARGLRVEPKVLERLVQEAFERLPRGLYRENPRRDLTPPEAEALANGGFVLDGESLDEEDPLLRTAAEYAALVKSSLTTKGAARRLHVAPSRIRQRLTSRPPTLYGIRLPSGWRIPEFQLERDALLPGMEKVVAALDPELHPISVYRWFVTPTPDLTVEDRDVSPRDWLRLGQSPVEVVKLAINLP